MPRPSIACLICLLLTSSSPATAQDTADPLRRLASLTAPVVYVTDEAGLVTIGHLLRVDGDALVLDVGGREQSMPLAPITRVQTRGDSLRSGAIAGAITGLALGSLALALWDCPGGCAAQQALFLGYTTAVYTALGTAADALHTGRTTVYRRPAGRVSGGVGVTSGHPGRAVHAHLDLRW